MREVIAGIVVLVCLVLIPGSVFAYWVPDSYGQGIGPGPQGGYLGILLLNPSICGTRVWFRISYTLSWIGQQY
jgi:hypothetical protein